MISIIICSRNKHISTALEENIKSTIGVEYEIVTIDNSENKYSLFSAYNYGVKLSNYPYLCFVHEDVFFRTNKWGINLIGHLNKDRCGIVGVAGGKIATNVPAQWSNENRYIHIIQHYKKAKKAAYLKEPADNSKLCESVVLVDGVFLSMRRELFSHLNFDESLGGFHSYDYDISIQAIVVGYNNFVVYDILLEHFSAGFKDDRYYKNLIKVYKKWVHKLPLFTSDRANYTANDIQNIEKERLKKLIRRMAKTGFSTNEIVANTAYFVEILKAKGIFLDMKFIKLKVFFIKLYKSILFFKK